VAMWDVAADFSSMASVSSWIAIAGMASLLMGRLLLTVSRVRRREVRQ
jgi:hypothetical protein